MPRFNIKEEYTKLHSSFPIYSKKPIVGITGNYDGGKCTLLEGYYRSVLEAGGTPVVIPAFDDTDAMVSLLEEVDALILSGGGDINPLYLGEEPMRELGSVNPARDWQELMLVKLAANRRLALHQSPHRVRNLTQRKPIRRKAMALTSHTQGSNQQT